MSQGLHQPLPAGLFYEAGQVLSSAIGQDLLSGTHLAGGHSVGNPLLST